MCFFKDTTIIFVTYLCWQQDSSTLFLELWGKHCTVNFIMTWYLNEISDILSSQRCFSRRQSAKTNDVIKCKVKLQLLLFTRQLCSRADFIILDHCCFTHVTPCLQTWQYIAIASDQGFKKHRTNTQSWYCYVIKNNFYISYSFFLSLI